MWYLCVVSLECTHTDRPLFTVRSEDSCLLEDEGLGRAHEVTHVWFPASTMLFDTQQQQQQQPKYPRVRVTEIVTIFFIETAGFYKVHTGRRWHLFWLLGRRNGWAEPDLFKEKAIARILYE